MKLKNFFDKNRMQSLKYALNGLGILFCEESNSWMHLCIGICALIAGFLLKISLGEWIAIIFCIGFVFTLELINTSIENLSDFVSKEYHDLIKNTKDLSAGAVFVGGSTAIIVELIIFVPKIIKLLY